MVEVSVFAMLEVFDDEGGDKPKEWCTKIAPKKKNHQRSHNQETANNQPPKVLKRPSEGWVVAISGTIIEPVAK